MSIAALLLMPIAVTGLYFGIGRAACPRHDRLPLVELKSGDVTATMRRGWHALGDQSDLCRMVDAMGRRQQ